MYVWVAQLQSAEGTRFCVDGVETDEQRVQISDPVGARYSTTVADLKSLIIQHFFPGQQKSESRIKVYLFSSTDHYGGIPVVQNPRDALQENRLYGFLDLDPKLLQQLPRDDSWYRVTGAISRPTSHAGARYSLFRFASSDGLYPEGYDANTAFETFSSPREASRNVLKFSVVFQSLKYTANFVDEVGIYVQQSRGMLFFCDDKGNEVVGWPHVTPIAPYK